MKRILILFALILLVGGCSELKKIEQTKELMGTIVTITIYDENEDKAKEIMEKAFDEIERLDNLLSNYKNDFEVSLLNKNSFIENPSDDLVYNIKKSLYHSDISNGAFDITVQPILDLYKDSFESKKRAPTGEEIEDALKLVGYEKIRLKYRNISMQPGMKITLGGIAKGYAVDRAVSVLQWNNTIKHALVSIAGDIKAIGNKGGANKWVIALENPRNKGQYIAKINLDNKAVSTSGDYERYFEPTKKFHHIIDPETGYSATKLISVTIIADKAVDADAIATAVFVLGPDEGLQLIEKLENVEGLLITPDKKIIKSSEFDSCC